MSQVTGMSQMRQSPIDIRSEHVTEDHKTCQVSSIDISYTSGDCVDVIIDPTGFIVRVRDDCATMFQAAHLPSCFELAQFHSHWGRDGSYGSEHLLDGKAMSAEMHFMFWNSSYGSFERAKEKSDGLAVIAVFLKEGEFSSEYEPLISAIRRAREVEHSVSLPDEFFIHQLLPDAGKRDFATYLGSLTTPPYTESVIWTVFTRPIQVSKNQLDVLRCIMTDNFRKCQDLCDRTVLFAREVNAEEAVQMSSPTAICHMI